MSGDLKISEDGKLAGYLVFSDQDRRLIEAAPTILRELVEALEAMIVKREAE
jgi:hypothetical protein